MINKRGMVTGVLLCVVAVTTTQAYALKMAISADPNGYSRMSNVIQGLATAPKISQPQWLKEELAAEQEVPSQRHVVYAIKTLGIVHSDFNEFKTLVQQTLSDSRGWAGLGITFEQVSQGGSFTLILASPAAVGAASSGCSPELSCAVGSSVYINDDRWSGATALWNSAGGVLREYRHYVVNHEVGHWLGHGHRYCGGAGQLAPVMQQQSKGLFGCKISGWPLPAEKHAPRLGI